MNEPSSAPAGAAIAARRKTLAGGVPFGTSTRRVEPVERAAHGLLPGAVELLALRVAHRRLPALVDTRVMRKLRGARPVPHREPRGVSGAERRGFDDPRAR